MLPRLQLGLLLLSAPLSVPAQWTALQSGTRSSLRGLTVVDGRTVWASGSRGAVVHSTDGGASWRVDTVPGAATLDLRAIHARSATVAHVGSTSGRIWRTTDGGQTWSLRHVPTDTTTFLDAIDFWDDRHGIALGDPMGGHFLLLLTDDGGDTWHEATAASRPRAQDGEAAFAASGTILVVDGKDGVWIGSGGRVARLHHSTDRGRTWTVHDAPIRQGSSSQGIFALARDGPLMVVVGGDFQQDTATLNNVARFDPARHAWIEGSSSTPRGYRSGVATWQRIAIAVGPGGSDISTNGGGSWSAFDPVGFHAVRASSDGVFFASGSEGRVAVYHPPRAR